MGRSPFQRYCYLGKRLLLKLKRRILLTHGAKAFEKSVFSPCTPVRTWGTRAEWFGKRSMLGSFTNLIWTSLSFKTRKGQEPARERHQRVLEFYRSMPSEVQE
jgi:hypothetical protein